MIIIIYLGGKFAASHHMIDLVSTETNMQNPSCNEAANTQPLFNKATAHYNLIPTNYFYLEWIHQIAQNSYIYIELAKRCCALLVYQALASTTY